MLSNNKRNSVIVLGGHVQALGIVRALGQHGIPVYVLDHTKLGIARMSRYCSGFYQIPNWKEEYILKALEEMGSRYGPSVIFPTDDLSVSVLSRHYNRLREIHLLITPHWDITNKAYNKKLTFYVARDCNVPVPMTFFPESIEDLVETTLNWQFPIILKPAVMHTFYQATRKKVLFVSTHNELANAYRQMTSIIPTSEVMAQEIIPGDSQHLYSFCGLMYEGELVIGFSARRKRQIPMDFGSASTFVETCENSMLGEYGSRMLTHINYSGLAEVEFKYDIRDNEYKLLEINPRLWKWHSIVEGLGVNLPYLQYKIMKGDEVNYIGNLPYQACKWTDRLSDLYVSIGEIIKGKLSVGEWLSSYSGICIDSTFSRNDPLPGIYLLIISPYLAITH
jgi:D-aspartate ligase